MCRSVSRRLWAGPSHRGRAVKVTTAFTPPVTPTIVVTADSTNGYITVVATEGDSPVVSYEDIYLSLYSDGTDAIRVAHLNVPETTYTYYAPRATEDYYFMVSGLLHRGKQCRLSMDRIGEMDMATNRQLEQRLIALESWRTTAGAQIANLATRVAALEAGTGGSDATAIAALDARLDTLEAKTCVEQPRFAAIEAQLASNAAKDATEAAAQDVLESDHVPTP